MKREEAIETLKRAIQAIGKLPDEMEVLDTTIFDDPILHVTAKKKDALIRYAEMSGFPWELEERKYASEYDGILATDENGTRLLQLIGKGSLDKPAQE